MARSWLNSSISASQADSASRIASVNEPASDSAPTRWVPSPNTKWHGSAASCGTWNGCTSRSPMANASNGPNTWVRGTGPSFQALRVPALSQTGMRCLRAKRATPPMWSACSWVTTTASTARGSTPSRRRRFSVSRSMKPQSISTVVAPAWTSVPLPRLPLPSIAKRISSAVPALGECRERHDLAGAFRERADLGSAGLVDLVDADHRVHRDVAAHDAFELGLELFLARVDHDARLFAEHQLLDLDESQQRTMADVAGVDLVDLPLVHEGD